MRTRASLLVCDLDNTLYDWVGYFVPSLYAMIDAAVSIMSCDRETLLDDLRSVHQRYHNSEHPYSLLETNTFSNWAEGKGPVSRTLIDPALHAFNSSRKKLLKLYPTVQETLGHIQDSGTRIVAYSDSGYYAVVDRIKRLDLEDRFEMVYCSPRFDDRLSSSKDRERWTSEKVRELHHVGKKPNPIVLREICSDQGVSPIDAVYVGDSLAKDIMMAKQAGLCSVWAKFGLSFNPDLYQQLIRVSHWTADDVRNERAFSRAAAGVVPDYECESLFSEVLRMPAFEHVSQLSAKYSAA